jgi:hypothetical protein
MTIRQWLRANNYKDIADMIDEILAEFKATGSKERRNWADVLCGHGGKPITVADRTFPMLASAQRSRRIPVSPEAIQRNEVEDFPGARVTGRWPKKHKLSRVKTKRLLATRANRVRHARAS